MPELDVVLTDVGGVVWRGAADTPLDACRAALRSTGLQAGEFLPYEMEPVEHKEDGIERVVLSVYRTPPDGAHTEDDYLGTFMARVV